MTTNMGSLDRILRLVVGIALVLFALFGSSDIAWKWVGWIGVVPIVTAAIGWCPAYTILGIKTCKSA
ncbi:YgaP family membrane protein [Polymorphum gilvum]|uniref:Probable transmembrane protein n=1 Tax=Polymorphum gilvum (strain LMG 25793 / CGMCC 1.9160 / SL003B-26A1) TaxID=991905 RepID=F2IV62_POLGS|nr:DUF2892 domain-containing protein [Polymorphum gilvum]ADZ71393.1 Probable transmembrane protein [Polymorphum gilvum SL003B-26A1]